MTSSNADYVASLEARIDEYEKQMACTMQVSCKEFEFIKLARCRYEMQDGISCYVMEKYFSDDPRPPTFRRMYIAIRLFIQNRINWFKENWGGFLFISFMVCLLGGMITAGIVESRKVSYNKEISEKIERSVPFDANADGIVTDDERRILLMKFIADNKLKVNEEDFYECIRNKKYYNFYNGEKKLSVDEIYDLITKKGVEK
jgi:hypothetical protein